MGEQVLIRFQAVEGIADTAWLTLNPGVAIMTGRNNVGKSRILEAASKLVDAFASAHAYPDVPQVRVVTDERTIELDPRPSGGVSSRFNPAPRSYTVRSKIEPNPATDYRMQWVISQSSNMLALKQFQGPNPSEMNFGADVTGFGSLNGILPMHSEFSRAVGRIIYIPPERPTQAEQATVAVELPAPDASDLGRAIYGHLMSVTPQAAALQSIVSKMFPEIERILTPPYGANKFILRLRDKFAGKDISLNNAGTGVARILHLITAILFYPAGKIFLIDEPTTHLHPGSEKVLARFIREHPEHDYVISTHSPIFINAIEPDRVWLVTRNDSAGTRLQRAFRGQLGRAHVFDELGASPGDIAVAERIIFVEGDTDVEIYPILFDRLGIDLSAVNATVLPIYGAGNAEAIQQTVDHLTKIINLRYLVYLDGDKRGKVSGAQVDFLPEEEIENLLLRDSHAVFVGFETVLGRFNPDRLSEWQGEWTEQRVTNFISERLATEPRAKGSKVLTDLGHEMKIIFNKALHGPAIARLIARSKIEDLPPAFSQFLEAGSPTVVAVSSDDAI